MPRYKHPKTKTHPCFATGCHIHVPTTLLMCRRHWYMVPKPLRDAIWQTYRDGPSGDHHANIAEARRLVEEAEN